MNKLLNTSYKLVTSFMFYDERCTGFITEIDLYFKTSYLAMIQTSGWKLFFLCAGCVIPPAINLPSLMFSLLCDTALTLFLWYYLMLGELMVQVSNYHTI